MARRRFLIGVSVAAVMIAGCHDCGRTGGRTHRRDGRGPLHARVTGAGSWCNSGGAALSDFGQLSVANQPSHRELDPYRRVRSNGIVRVEVSQLGRGKNFDYKALMCPPWRSVGTVEGWLESPDPMDPQLFSLDKDEQEPESWGPLLKMASAGWLFAWVHLPYIATQWVSAAAEGSMIAIQAVDETEQRVYFIEGKKITVRCLIGSNKTPVEWQVAGQFVTVTLKDAGTGPTCAFTQWQNIADTDWITINELKEAAKATE